MMNFRIRFSLTVAAVTVVAVALAGCTLPGNVPLGSSPLITGGTTIEESDRQASVLGSRLCIVNNSTAKMSIFWRGYPDARGIPAGGSNCNSGYESDRADVAGSLEYEPADTPGTRQVLSVAAHNAYINSPKAEALFVLPNGDKMGACNWYVPGKTKSFDTGWLHGTMTRLDDSEDNKEFVLTLTDKVSEPSGESCY
jgi:hypothetical protein